ncbi:MAG: phage terminase large subunit [Ignavibacteriaceae bacterium]|nr:phage terminase large subunit [Ignavibacteriaceae bacterium]
MKEYDLDINYHEGQIKIFFESNSRFKIIAKGRRFGLTRGFANYVVEKMLEGVSPILWIDTVYGNIERYVERYFTPLLKPLPKNLWRYRSIRNDLKIGGCVCDFRSADRPENIEGFGYAMIIINEAGIVLKNRNIWTETILPMVMDYKANVLIGGTPKGKRVKGKNEKHLFCEMFERGLNDPSKIKNKNGSEWKSFNFSSYENPLLDKNEIDEMAREIPPMLREQEIFGKFVDKEGTSIIKREWWKFYNENDFRGKRIIKVVQSWDTAYKINEGNDFSVCTTWIISDNGYYLKDMWRGRVEFPELKKMSVSLYEKFRPNEVLIEDKASGQSLVQELKRETRIPIKAIKIDKDKLSRVNAITTLIEGEKVFLPTGKNFTDEVIAECEEFPDSEYDDIVDSISQFLNHAKGITSRLSSGPILHVERDRIKRKYTRYRS